jgi:hypothetical protein
MGRSATDEVVKDPIFERTFASFSDVVVDNLHDLDRIFVLLMQPLTMVCTLLATQLN